MALNIRLMAGHELMHEGFGAEQSGSSAMPHKMNSRTCERINALKGVLRGHLTMAAEISGNQWFEGDVSCSVVRRVIFPDAFLATDGLFESALTVLGEMEIFPVMIRKELEEYLPFLSTTRILTAARKKGIGREEAHKAIKEAALYGLKKKRAEGDGNGADSFMMELMTEKSLDFEPEQLEALTSTAEIGLASNQTDKVCEMADRWMKRFPDAVSYSPEPIL
jgi:adenylosuccinate lyase